MAAGFRVQEEVGTPSHGTPHRKPGGCFTVFIPPAQRLLGWCQSKPLVCVCVWWVGMGGWGGKLPGAPISSESPLVQSRDTDGALMVATPTVRPR